MRKSIARYKDVADNAAKTLGIDPEIYKGLYAFSLIKLNRLSEDPKVLYVRMGNFFGTLFVRARLIAQYVRYHDHRTTKNALKFCSAYKEKLAYMRTFPQLNRSIHYKIFTVESKWLGKNMTKEELEKEQNDAYKEENRVD